MNSTDRKRTVLWTMAFVSSVAAFAACLWEGSSLAVSSGSLAVCVVLLDRAATRREFLPLWHVAVTVLSIATATSMIQRALR